MRCLAPDDIKRLAYAIGVHGSGSRGGIDSRSSGGSRGSKAVVVAVTAVAARETGHGRAAAQRGKRAGVAR